MLKLLCQAMSSTCDNFIARRSRDLIQHSLNLWIMSWSARLMHHTRTLRLLRHAIATWTEKYYKVSIDLDARGAALLEHWAMRTKQECWNQWTAAISCRVEMNNQAEMFVLENTRLRYWTRWQMVLRRKAIDANKARVARDFFLQRRAWSAWHERLQARNTKRWIAKQVNRRKREILLCESSNRSCIRSIPRLTPLHCSLARKSETVEIRRCPGG